MRNRAFTLAEVLITLTIIGVIAAITIPNLMQSWRKHERITQIKTAYSIIQNATKMAVAEYGNPDGWDFDGGGYIIRYFTPYVKVSKICGKGTGATFKGSGCFIDNNKNGTWYSLKGTSFDNAHGNGYNPTYYYTMILQNGMHVGIWAPEKPLQNYSWTRHIFFLVDVDGAKGPTTLGKDIFIFRYSLDTGKFNTGGDPANYSQNDCTLTSLGTSCAYWIERNHWEFPENYPIKKF